MNPGPLDRKRLGQMLTYLANASIDDIFASDSPSISGKAAYRIGFTGPPGAGKSSLVGRLAQLRSQGIRMGVLAIDPSSPKSGGAILGDRIRMDELADLNDLYIRSFGSRSTLDGLTDNLPEIMAAMDNFSFDEVVLETVGVGQAEYAVRQQVDTLVLVLLPDSGDVVQAMKAGIMEMADIFVVNKSDLAGARKMAADVKRIATLRKQARSGWRSPVVLTSMDDSGSIEELSGEIDRHRIFMESNGGRDAQLLERSKYRIRRIFEREILSVISKLDPSVFEAPLSEQYKTLVTRLSALHST